jgi:DNA polymerase III delta subunit
MSTYAQWRTAADKGETRRVTWVCGNQPVLVEEVVDTTRAALLATDLDYTSLTAGQHPDRDIWAAALQYPLQPGVARLVLVRDAHRISHWAPLNTFLTAARQLPTNHLLFVSPEPDFPAHTVAGKRAGLAAHAELIRGKGRLVRCAMPNETDLIAWVRRRAPAMDDEMIRYLLTRAGANLATVAGTCKKIAALKGNPGPATIDVLCTPAPAESFVDNLLARKPVDALRTVATLTDRDALAAIALLDTRLDLLAALWRSTRAGLSARDVTGVPVFLVRRYLPIAKHYDPKRVVYARRVLAVVDNALRNGARGGVLEALTALW